jgi:hypothetical protein
MLYDSTRLLAALGDDSGFQSLRGSFGFLDGLNSHARIVVFPSQQQEYLVQLSHDMKIHA